MTPSNSILGLLDLHMFCDHFLLVIPTELFVNRCSDLFGLVYILEHCLR